MEADIGACDRIPVYIFPEPNSITRQNQIFKELSRRKLASLIHTSIELVTLYLESNFEIPPFFMGLQAKAGKSSGSLGFGATSCTTTSGRGPVSSSLLPRPPRAPLDPRPGRGRLPKLISS